MDEVWERAVETALDGESDGASARSLTLDGAVKCIHGRLPPPDLLEKFQSLEHLSIANVGVSSLEQFPRLRNLQRLILSDNRIAGGLEHLVGAGLDSLRDLDLSNNRIQFLEDLAPLAELKLVSLDLYECPVTRIKDYRARVFAMIKSLKYLDKMDADENERPESDEEDEDDEEEEEDPGSGEVDGEERSEKMNGGVMMDGDIDDDEDDDDDGEDSDEGVDDEDDDERGENGTVEWSSEEIDEEDGGQEEEDVENVEVHEVDDSEEEDGVEEDEDDDDEEDVEEDEDDGEAPASTGRLTSTEGEIDGHDQGEEDENGEIGEEDGEGVEEDVEFEEDDGVDEEDDFGAEYLVQPIGPAEIEEANGSDLEPGNEEDGDDEQDVEDEDDLRFQQRLPSSSSQLPKRKRDGEEDDDDSVEDGRSSKRH